MKKVSAPTLSSARGARRSDTVPAQYQTGFAAPKRAPVALSAAPSTAPSAASNRSVASADKHYWSKSQPNIEKSLAALVAKADGRGGSFTSTGYKPGVDANGRPQVAYQVEAKIVDDGKKLVVVTRDSQGQPIADGCCEYALHEGQLGSRSTRVPNQVPTATPQPTPTPQPATTQQTQPSAPGRSVASADQHHWGKRQDQIEKSLAALIAKADGRGGSYQYTGYKPGVDANGLPSVAFKVEAKIVDDKLVVVTRNSLGQPIEEGCYERNLG